MKRILALALTILSLATPVSATSPEATLLDEAVTAVNASAETLVSGASTIEDQVVASADILDGIGDLDEYSDACKPLAHYVIVLATSWHGALAALAAGDTPAIGGNLSVALALFDYYQSTDGLIPVITNDCEIGL